MLLMPLFWDLSLSSEMYVREVWALREAVDVWSEYVRLESSAGASFCVRRGLRGPRGSPVVPLGGGCLSRVWC